MDKQTFEEGVIQALRPCEGKYQTQIDALTNVLPFSWNWVKSGDALEITSETVDITIRGHQNITFLWKD